MPRSRTIAPVMVGVPASLFLLAACLSARGFREPGRARTPSAGGVITERQVTNGLTFLTLHTGQQVELDERVAQPLQVPARQPNVDDLLFYGSEADGAWYEAVPSGGSEADCYYLIGPARDDGGHILTEYGLRLPKAPHFDPGKAARRGASTTPKEAAASVSRPMVSSRRT